MSDLQNFDFDFEGYGIRFVGTPEKPECVAADLCKVLGIANTSDALADFDEDERGIATVYTPGDDNPDGQEMLTVKEPGIYRLIVKSRKPIAKRFQKWLFNDVLPSIRKTGTYSITQPTSTEPILLPVRVRKEKLELIQIGIDIISQLGGIDERTELQFKDLARSIVLDDHLQSPILPGTNAPALPGSSKRLEYPISDRALELGYNPTPGQLKSIGKGVAALYRARYGKEPPKREQFVDGTTRKVNCYSEEDLPILDQAIKAFMERA